MPKNTNPIPKFFTDIKTLGAFLAVLLLVVMIFVVVFQPASFFKADPPVSSINIYIFTVIVISSGLGILSISRIILFFVQRRITMELFHFVIWIFAELIVMAVLLTVIVFFIGNQHNLTFSDMLWHVALDMLSILIVPYIITILLFALNDKRLQIDELRNLVDATAALVPSEADNINFYDRGRKLAFSTRRANVLYIAAADNYCNIHYMNGDKEDTFILHNSMKQLDSSDDYKGLLRCHRGYMVNIENVKLLRKDKEGLVLELSQGDHSIPVSRTYNDRVVRFFAGYTPQTNPS